MPSIIKALEIRAQLPHHDEARVVRLDVTEGSEKSMGQVLELQGLDSFEVDVNTSNAAMGGSILYNATPTDRDIVLRVKPYFGFENTLVNLMSEYQMHSTFSNEHYIFLDVLATDGEYSCPIVVQSSSSPLMQDTDEVTIELLSPQHLFYKQGYTTPRWGFQEGPETLNEDELHLNNLGVQMRAADIGPRKFSSLNGQTLYGYGYYIDRPEYQGEGIGPLDYEIGMRVDVEFLTSGYVFGVGNIYGEFFGVQIFKNADWFARIGPEVHIDVHNREGVSVKRYFNGANRFDAPHKPIREAKRGAAKLLPTSRMGYAAMFLPEELENGWRDLTIVKARLYETRLGF